MPRFHWPALELGGARAALPLARAGVGRCPGPGNSAWREGARAGGVAREPGAVALLPRRSPWGLSRRGGRGRRRAGVGCLPHTWYLASVLTANPKCGRYYLPAFFFIEEKTGLARSSSCRLRAEHAAGAVPTLPAVTRRGSPIPSLRLREYSRNIAQVTVAACFGTGVLRHQAIACFIMRHQDSFAPFTSVPLHSQRFSPSLFLPPRMPQNG